MKDFAIDSRKETREGAQCGLAVYYDGSCPLCKREVRIYQRAQSKVATNTDALKWIDVSKETAIRPSGKIMSKAERSLLMSRFHVETENGQRLSGAAAFVELWSRVPGWAWLAKTVKLLRLTPLLEGIYRLFLRIRPRVQKFTAAWDADHLPRDLIADLRSDHAGETGAVWIYKGILMCSKSPEVIAFAKHHLATEQTHLHAINRFLPPLRRSLLLPGWKLAGFLTGALPALAGPRAVFGTIAAVESFVEKHYEYQIQALNGREDFSWLQAQLLNFQRDEINHHHDAQSRHDSSPGRFMKAWCWLVGFGSSTAVKLARLI